MGCPMTMRELSRRAAALICDADGSCECHEGVPPDDWADALEDVLTTIREAGFGAAGDGEWGVPDPDQNPVPKPVHTALKIIPLKCAVAARVLK